MPPKMVDQETFTIFFKALLELYVLLYNTFFFYESLFRIKTIFHSSTYLPLYSPQKELFPHPLLSFKWLLLL